MNKRLNILLVLALNAALIGHAGGAGRRMKSDSERVYCLLEADKRVAPRRAA